MAWTTPRDWTAGEVVTESHMDVHVRDNLTYLKDIFDGVQGQDIQFSYAAADAVGRNLMLRKARGTLAVPTAISAGDVVGDVETWGYLGGAYRLVSLMRGQIPSIGATYPDGALAVYVSRQSDGSAVEAARATIGSVASATQWQVADGTAAAPGLAFINDPDTGLYRTVANELALAAGGVVHARFAAGQAYFENGTTSLPAITFYSDFDTGFARTGTDSMVLVAGTSICLWAQRTGGLPQLGFYGLAAQNQQTVTGSRGANAALTSLLTALHTIGLVVNSSTV